MTYAKHIIGMAFLAALALAPVFLPVAEAAANAIPREGIAAVVNEDVITYSDLDSRLKLAMAASNLPDRPEIVDRLRPQIAEVLVDETLKLQEAERLGIAVSETEVDNGFANIAGQNNMTADQFLQALASKNVPAFTMREQVRAQIAWTKVIQRKLRPQVNISEEDIDAVMLQRRENAGKPEYLLAEIFLSVETPDEDAQVRARAEKLVDQIINGAPFPAVANQFSQAAGASLGGDLGWVQADQLPDELKEAVFKMQTGQISPPIRSLRGYHILLLRDQRTAPETTLDETKVSLKQLYLPMENPSDEKEAEKLIRQADKLRTDLENCGDMDRLAGKYPSEMTGDLGEVKLGELPPVYAKELISLPLGKPSKALSHNNGVSVLMVCARSFSDSTEAERDAIAHELGLQRLDLLQRRLLRDLKSSAYIERRG